MNKIIIFSLLIFNLILNAGTMTLENNTSGDIPDKGCIDRTFDMPISVIITDITIEVNIDHTYRADLDIKLTLSERTTVDLTSDNGGGADNLYVKFNDKYTTNIEEDTNTHTITVERGPEAALSTFDGEDANGTWTLKICDVKNRDTGTFNYAILDINDTPQPPPPPIEGGLQVNFQMDECYWMGGANGVTDDVKDSSGNTLHAQSRNKADNIEVDAKICRAGNFVNNYESQTESDAVYYPNSTASEENIGKKVPFTVSAWVYRLDDDKWMAGVVRSSDSSWSDGWGLIHTNSSFIPGMPGSKKYLDFFVGRYDTYARIRLSTDTWTHVVGTYNGYTIKIYKDGVLEDSKVQEDYELGALPISIGDDVSVSDDSDYDDRWRGSIDEVKVWNRILTDAEITQIYNNENSGFNFDGTARECKPCNGSSIAANSWDLISIPADSRSVSLSVDEVLGDDMNGTYATDWLMYKRTYSTTDNSSAYEALELNSTLDFGQSYWLASKLDSEWYIDGTPTVDYDSSSDACTADECVEIDLTSVTHDFAVDGDDGTGPYRYNMSGFTDIVKPVEWADCRFIIDDTAYTPTDANLSGYANKQIWFYNGTGTDKSNSYITCDDTMSCKLVPFKGFWIELHGSTKGKSVKLLIPKG
ncbi:MAG: LamG-like jellyroll fold domain-containing protein [Campylobacterota bacterium]|nr:LamG-like jellyroll fold domain-containing protein [Campylobacterota bacterium]